MMLQMQCNMYMTLLFPLGKKVLDKLSSMLLSDDRKIRRATYLTTSLLLHSCTMMTRRNEEFARQINLSVGKSVFLLLVATLFT